ncbi:anthrone oxygenase family protein [Rhizobium terrae]|uniref:anthrone oxygenase family protein n=1 Tax=Rhizobium terrae TaxID=2171756 RepID=UPI001D029D0E|nr:anthrone oxygenase family protein [Rhizobium terrae]
MHVFFEVLAALLAAISLSFALAHAAELPGKMRLDKERYFTVQTIYYPGFTIGGISELASIVAVLVLLLATPYGSTEFWLVAGAVLALAVMQAIFWLITQPVNKFWLKDTDISNAAEHFFRTGATETDPASGWTVLRDRWERSHVLRCIAAILALVLLLVAVAR